MNFMLTLTVKQLSDDEKKYKSEYYLNLFIVEIYVDEKIFSEGRGPKNIFIYISKEKWIEIK